MYQPFQDRVHYVAISDADRHPSLKYAATIHHGIKLEDFAFDGDGSHTLLFFGRIHPDKGAAEAIAAAQAAGRELDLYGVVQHRDYYEREVLPHLSASIRYHGPVGGTERVRALGQARALLHLINFDEPFGLSVIEAMACGTPVIANRRGSMPELIEDGVNGFLVDSFDEAIAAIARCDEIDRTGCRRRVAELFSIKRMADQYIALYRQVCG